MGNLRTCSKCGIPKPESDYHRTKNRKDGLHASCIACESMRRRGKYQENIEHMREEKRKYAAAHREQAKERARRWYHENKERGKESRRKWREENKDRHIATNQEWYDRNREQVKVRVSEYQKERPEMARAHSQRRRAKVMNCPGVHTADDIKALYESQGGICVYHGVNPNCLERLENGYTVDHIMPISRGGTNWPDNIQLLCGPCNSSKGARNHEEFLAYSARLHSR